MRVYVAAPYQRAPQVRELHDRLRRQGFYPTSSWAEWARGPEPVRPAVEMRRTAEENDLDVRRADVVVVLAFDREGGEMFSEARFALELKKPVLWSGRRILSAYRQGVVLCDDVDDVLATLVQRRSRVP